MRTYDELTGARGRKIYYRADRYPARELFKKNIPDVEIDGNSLVLNDVSMSGLSASTGNGGRWIPQAGSEVTVTLRIDDFVLFEEKAQISRTEEIPGGTKVALGFVSGCLDVSEVVARYKDITARCELDSWLGPDAGDVPVQYRAIAAEVVYFLRRYRSVFDRLNLKSNGKRPPHSSQTSDLLAECEARAMPEWTDLWHRANRTLLPLADDPVAMRAVKRFTESVVTPEFMAAPFWRRAYEKPLGYPGDYEVMNYVYRWEAVGDTPFARFVHRLAVRTAECVATRMITVRDAIVDTIEVAAGAGGPVRITSVGSGPAQEVLNVLEAGPPDRPVEFTLIDQDRNALSYAYERTYPHTIRPGARASLKCLQVSFMQLFGGRGPFEGLPPQDMIYTIGLIDYLSQKRSKWLVENLYGRLRPGGRLLVANMRASDESTFWPMEVVTDWSVQYRSEQEMWALAEGLDAAERKLEADSTGHVYMLHLRKP